MNTELTADRARELLDYDPESGVLRRRCGPSAGAIVRTRHCRGYLQVSLDNKLYLAHRVAWLITHGRWPSGEIDHRDGVRTNNRLANLRDCTRAENAQNERGPRSNNNSGPLGTTRDRGQWKAQIKLHGKSHFLGRFSTPEEASAAYSRAKTRMHPFSTLGSAI